MDNTILYAEPDGQRTAWDPGAAEEPRTAAALRPLAPGMRRLLFTASVLVLLAAMVSFRAGASEVARVLLIGGAGLGLLFLVPLLKIYTPGRSRVVRYGKWLVLAAMPVLAFWLDAGKFSWLLVATLWPVFWIERTRISIRRKLPVAQWPNNHQTFGCKFRRLPARRAFRSARSYRLRCPLAAAPRKSIRSIWPRMTAAGAWATNSS